MYFSLLTTAAAPNHTKPQQIGTRIANKGYKLRP
jgi:hypothetical protein